MPLNSSEGMELWYFIPTIASATLAPTASEVAAGVEITKGVAASPTGFTSEATFIEVPNLKSRITPKIPGRINLPDSGLTMYYGDAVGDTERTIYALFPRDTAGYIARILPVNGAPVAQPIVAATKIDVYKIKVASRAKLPPEFGQALRYQVGIGIVADTAEDIAVLA